MCSKLFISIARLFAAQKHSRAPSSFVTPALCFSIVLSNPSSVWTKLHHLCPKDKSLYNVLRFGQLFLAAFHKLLLLFFICSTSLDAANSYTNTIVGWTCWTWPKGFLTGTAREVFPKRRRRLCQALMVLPEVRFVAPSLTFSRRSLYLWAARWCVGCFREVRKGSAWRGFDGSQQTLWALIFI